MAPGKLEAARLGTLLSRFGHGLRRSAFLTLLVAACGFPAQAAPVRQAKARFVQTAPTLDGVLDEAVWAGDGQVQRLLQRDPKEGEASTEKTEVWIVYTRQAIFFGIRCWDSNPTQIVATERRRDQDLTKDDSVGIILDTFHDRRNGFLFRTNPLGAKYDALVTDEGRDINLAWDEKWEAAASADTEGWSVEVMIPFKSLRMQHQEEMIWGLDFERIIRRKNEYAYWNGFNRNFAFENISQAGQLLGLREIEAGLRLRVKPFFLGGFEQTPGPTRETAREGALEVGLELLKYRPTESLTLDFSLNTDFAQSEVDDLVTNITRFPLFFPEKREFFLEGAGIFEFGTGIGLGRSRDFKLFFSRRIGLSENREPIPVLGGVKLTGRVGKYTVGVLDMQTDSAQEQPGNNYGVFRLKRDILNRSNVGAMFTNRQSPEEDDYNRVYGVDGNFVFADNLNIYSFLAKSDTPDLPRDDWSYFGRVLWDSDFFMAGAEYLVVQRNFNPELGFLPRRDQKRSTLRLGVRPRPDSDLIRQLVFRTRLDFTQNQAGKQESILYHFFTFESLFQSGDRLVVDVHRNFERLFEPFQIRPDVAIPSGSYRGWDVVAFWDGAPQRRISGGNLFRFRYEWGFFGGARSELRAEPLIKLSDALSVEVGYALDDVKLPFGRFTSHVLNTRFNYAFSNRWLTSTTVQYSNLDQLLNFRFRLNFIHRPGDDFFLIYNEGRNTSVDELRRGLLGRALMLKFTRSLDF